MSRLQVGRDVESHHGLWCDTKQNNVIMSTVFHTAFAERLEEACSKFPSRAAFAKTAGIPPSSLQTYFEGAEPTRPVLVALARAANVSLDWLAEGRGGKEPRPPVPKGYGEIPYYDVLKSGGYVYPLIGEEIAEHCYLKLAWLEREGIAPDKLIMLLATESLVPEIRLGDLMVVDTSFRTRFTDSKPTILPGIYLVSLQARLWVRELLGGSEGFVEMTAGNRRKKVRLHVGQDGFTVHGLVVWYGRSLIAGQKPKLDS